MRKIDNDSQKAFWNGKEYHQGNTKVTRCVLQKGTALWLHGHLIATLSDTGKLSITLAGYNTNVTRARLNAILERTGCKIYNEKNRLYIFIPTMGTKELRSTELYTLTGEYNVN